MRPLRYESSQLQEENVLIKQYLYPRYTSIGELGKEFKKLSYVDQLSSLSKSINRTQQIVEDIVANFKTGRTCLVLSERVDHLQLIEAEVSKHLSSNDLYKLIGAGNKKIIKMLSRNCWIELRLIFYLQLGNMLEKDLIYLN